MKSVALGAISITNVLCFWYKLKGGTKWYLEVLFPDL